jgi:hypothetical protein
MGAAGRPPHLLLFDEPFADYLIYSELDETGALALRHHPDPMTPFDYMQVPEIPIPEMRKPLRPPRMTRPNTPNQQP